MSVAVFSEHLGNWGPHRARDLYNEGTINAVYAKVWPLDAAARANALAWDKWRVIYPGPLWAWMVCSADQPEDVFQLEALEPALQPDGWVLNIEKALEGVSLSTIIKGAKATGKPVRASLAGIDASHVEYDYRALDKADVEVDWQAYFDSGEGPTPAEAVRELYESSFVIPGWEYRARVGARYGWGKATEIRSGSLDRSDWDWAIYDSYRDPGTANYGFRVDHSRSWGYTLVDRRLAKLGGSADDAGRLLGRARYSMIRVTIVSDEIALDKTGTTRTPAAWTAFAASARMPGLRRRPVDVYLAERASDEVLRAIAAGTG